MILMALQLIYILLELLLVAKKHNNHYTFTTSAKLALKWYEFDIGWIYICILQKVGLAKVKKLHQYQNLITKISG